MCEFNCIVLFCCISHFFTILTFVCHVMVNICFLCSIGRDGDGLIYYDFDWNSTGVEATRYQQRKIPPIVAEEVTVDATYDSIIEYIKPVRILGATTDDAINGYSTDLIYGGVQIVPTAQNTPSGDIVLATALAEPTLIAEAGTRSLGPFDCTGLTGKNCCLMIKHKVRDSNVNGRAIQCYLDYADGTIKHESHLNARGKKVFIFENHRGRISKEPKVRLIFLSRSTSST